MDRQRPFNYHCARIAILVTVCPHIATMLHSGCNASLWFRDTYNSKTASAVLFLSKSEGGGMLPWILDVQLLKSAGKIHAVLYSCSVKLAEGITAVSELLILKTASGSTDSKFLVVIFANV